MAHRKAWRPVKRVTTKKRKNGTTYKVTRWVARYPTADGKRKSAGTFKTEREAQEAIDKAMAREAKLEPGMRTATVREYAIDPATEGARVSRWLAKHPRSTRSNRTYASRLRRIADVEVEGKPLGDHVLRELRRRHATDLVEALYAKGYATGGVSAVFSAIKTVHEDAIDDDYAEFNPWKGVRIRRHDKRALKPNPPKRIWTMDALHEFAAYAPTQMGRTMLRVLIDCGLRPGELFGLERGDYEHGMIHLKRAVWEGEAVPPSNEKNHNRDIPVPPSADQMIRDLPTKLHVKWLFSTQTDAMWREHNFYRRVLYPTIVAANEGREGVRLDPTPREMRRTYVSTLRAAGIDPADLADVTGHTVETATRSYTFPMEQSYDAIRRVIG